MLTSTFNDSSGSDAAKMGYGFPNVIDNGRSWDLLSRLMEDKIILVQGQINQGMAGAIVAQLMFLGEKYKSDPEKTPISLYIDSPGGSIAAGLAIYDAMSFVQARYGVPISTVGMGMNMSMGSFLISCGTPGHRLMMPNSDHMVHQPSGGVQGTATEMNINNEYMKETKGRLAQLYVTHALTKMSYEDIIRLSDNGDSYMRAEECLKLGIIDRIMYPDEVMEAGKKLGTTYPPEVEEHLKRISNVQRKMNQHHAATREAQRTPPGMYSQLDMAA